MTPKQSSGWAALPKDVDNFQHCLSWAFTISLEAMRGISRDHPGAYERIDDGFSRLFCSIAKPPSDCLEPVKAVSSIVHSCSRELLDELIQSEDPRRAMRALDSFDADMISNLVALVIQIVRLTSSDSESVSKKAKALVEGVGPRGCAEWLDEATADNFPGVASMLEDWDRGFRDVVFPE